MISESSFYHFNLGQPVQWLNNCCVHRLPKDKQSQPSVWSIHFTLSRNNCLDGMLCKNVSLGYVEVLLIIMNALNL